MAIFHRLNNPTYFVTGGGDLLVGYDKINDPAHPSVGGAGVPAPFDGLPKSGGPNDGSYFVSFREDATSFFTNRSNFALAQNTDLLDNVANESIPYNTFVDFAAGAIVLSKVITDDVFVGVLGTANTQENRNRLVQVTDQFDIGLEVVGLPIEVTSIDDGALNNVVGTSADGFYTNPTVRFLIGIPAAQAYRIHYGARTSFASTSLANKGNLFLEALKTTAIVPSILVKLLRELHAEPPVGQLWNDPWDSTVRSLAASGLNERYRRGRFEPAGFVSGDFDMPGAGRTIFRDGGAVEIEAPNFDTTAPTVVSPYPDPQLALLRQGVEQPIVPGQVWPDGTRGGDIFLYAETALATTFDPQEETRTRVSGGYAIEAIQRDVRDNTLNGTQVKTRVSTGVFAVTNPSGGGAATQRCEIEIQPPGFFRALGETALRVTDLLEVSDNGTGVVLGTFRIDILSTDTILRVRTLSGERADFGTTPTTVVLRWLQPTMWLGAYQAYGGALGNSNMRPYMFMAPAPLLIPGNFEPNITAPVLCLSAEQRRVPGNPTNPPASHYYAFQWGGFNGTVTPFIKGTLEGDGGIVTSGGRQELNLIKRRRTKYTVGTSPVTHNPQVAGSSIELLILQFTTSKLVSLLLDSDYTPSNGDELHVTIELEPGSTGTLTFTWPSAFTFSGSDRQVPTSNPGTSAMVIHFAFKYFDRNSDDVWLCTNRADYLLDNV